MSTCGEDLTRMLRLISVSLEVTATQRHYEFPASEEQWASSASRVHQLPTLCIPSIEILGSPSLPSKRARYTSHLQYSRVASDYPSAFPFERPQLTRNAVKILRRLRASCEVSDTDEEEQVISSESVHRASKRRPGTQAQWVGLRRSDLSQIKKYDLSPEHLPQISCTFENFRPEQLISLLSRAQPQHVQRSSSVSHKKFIARKEYPQSVPEPTRPAKQLTEKVECSLLKKSWVYMMKKDLGRAAKCMGKQRNDLRNNAKRLGQLANKEVQKKANKMQRETREAGARARRLQREMVTFWRRRERETADMKRKRDKEELETRKRREEEEESARQRKRLEYLMMQSEIYSHFMARKLGIVSSQSTHVSSIHVKEAEAKEVIKNKILEDRERVQAFDKQKFNNEDLKDLGLTGLDQVDEKRIFSHIEGPPPCFTGQLKDYQVKGLRWLDNLYEQGINGILADEMGLGKTIQTIALLAHLSFNKHIWGPFLIICPSSTLHNWQEELSKFCATLKVLPYWGQNKERKALRKYMHNKKLSSEDSPFHICITSYQLVLADVTVFQKIMWKYMILDEAHAIKNTATQRWNILLGFNARNKLLLTGTPIQNSMAELWALLHFIMPKLFDSHDHFQEWFSKDIEAHSQDAGALNQHQLQRLHAILKPFMLRRIKKDVESEIGQKSEHEYFCELSQRQRMLYERIKKKLNITEFFSMTDSKAKVENLMNLMMQFRKVCNHPDLFERRPEHAPVIFSSPLVRSSQLRAGFNQLLEIRSGNLNPIAYCLPRIVYCEYLKCRQLPMVYDASYFWLFRSVGLSYNEGLRCIFADDLMRGVLALLFVTKYKRLAAYSEWKRPLLLPVHCTRLRKIRLDPCPAVTEFIYTPKVIAAPIDFYSSTIHFHNLCAGALHSPVLKTLFYGGAFRPSFYFECPKQDTIELTQKGLVAPVPSYIDLPTIERLLQDSAKLKLLDTLLRASHQGGHRVLIFCQMTKMLDILEEYLYSKKYSFLRMDGSTSISDRNYLITEFQNNENIFVFILSTRAGGLGVNLTAADTVIFYDIDWNPTMDAQATDRVHRIGQTKAVTIYKLITGNTVEERILQRAKEKQTVQSTVYAGGAFKADIFKPSEVMDLLFDERDFDKVAHTQKFIGISKRKQKKLKDGEEFNISDFVGNEIN